MMEGYVFLMFFLLMVAVEANCPTNIDQSTDPGVATTTVTFTAPTNHTCTPDSGESFSVGANTVMCTDGDSPCTFTVNVTDDEKPTIDCPSDPSFNTNPKSNQGTGTWRNPSASDNVGVTDNQCNPASGGSFDIGTTSVTCTVMDAAGNDATCTFQLTVNDNESPVLDNCPESIRETIPYPNSQNTLSGVTVTWVLPAANDNSGEVTLSSTHDPGSEFEIGVTTVTYTAVDSSGNMKTCQFDVTVGVQPPNDRIFIEGVITTTSQRACMTVVWPESDDKTIEDYSIYVYIKGNERPDKSQRIVVPVGMNTYIKKQICNLHPGELYIVEVMSQLNGDNGLSKEQWTKPNPPRYLTVVPGTLSTSSFEVSWQRSTQNVQQYFVRYSDGRWEYVTNTTDSIMVDSFFPSIPFSIDVASVVGSGDDRLQSGFENKRVTTAALRESELFAYNYTESTIAVAWITKSSTRGELEPYMLLIEPRDAEENFLKVFNPESPAFTTFKGLKPNTEYRIRLISNLGLSLETTQKTRPGRVTNIRPTEVFQDSITLKWDPPTEGDVVSYDILVSPSIKSDPINEHGTSYIFKQLTNNTEYFFQIVSIYDGMNSVPQTLMVTTGVTKPAPPPPLDVAIVVGPVLGVLVLALAIALFVMCLKLHRLQESGRTSREKRSNSDVVNAHRQRYQAPKRHVDSNDVYEVTGTADSTPKPKNHHYQNAKIGALFGQKKQKSPKPPMMPIRTIQNPPESEYAEPDING